MGADYQGTADSDYLHALRNNLDAGIEVMWTGPRVRSRRFGAAEARRFRALLGRRPIIWDNWLALDFVPGRVFLGPYAKRSGVAEDVRGFLLNLADTPELNFLPLSTAVDWMNAPARYRPRRSWLRAVKELSGARSPALRAFAETSYSTTLSPKIEAPTFVRLSHRLLRAVRRGGAGRNRIARAVLRELKLVQRGSLIGRVPVLAPMADRLRPFLLSASRQARAGEVATRLLLAQPARSGSPASHRTLAGAGAGSLRARLLRLRGRREPKQIATFGSRSAWSNLRFGNVMDRFVRRSLAIDARRRAAERRQKAKRRS